MSRLVYQAIDNKYVRLTEPWVFYSKIIADLYPDIPDGKIEASVDFVFDLESVPRIPIIYSLVANTSKQGGCGHDLLCRKDSVPIVSKKVAADVYLEIMENRERFRQSKIRFGKLSFLKRLIEKKTRFHALWKRHAKYWVVRVVPGYFHQFSVNSTYEEISGKRE